MVALTLIWPHVFLLSLTLKLGSISSLSAENPQFRTLDIGMKILSFLYLRSGHFYLFAKGGISGGAPLAIYDSELNTLVLSPLSNFMVAGQSVYDVTHTTFFTL